MKTGNKITLFYSTVTIGIVAAVTVIFYLVATGYIGRLYYSYLIEKAYAVAEKHWEKDEVDDEGYARIQKQYEESLPVTTEILLNADSIAKTRSVLNHYLEKQQIDNLYAGKVIKFKSGEQLGAAIYYPDNEGNFIVLVISNNQYGGDIQHHIGWLLIGLLVISFIPIFFVGRFYTIRIIDRIDAAYQSEKSFINNASHELNNPLTAIQGECEISLMKERTPAEYQDALKRIASETKRIILLIKHLLFLSHGDSEILKNARETIRLSDFLQQFTDDRVHLVSNHSTFTVEANPHLLKIAIGNILGNACKYSNDDVIITLDGRIIEISDKGIGIPADELNRICQPFYRASNSHEFKGHGIGLSLSIRILETYGAQIQITSETGKGTNVKITFS